MDFTSRYNKLNAAQKQAVDTIDGPVMVIAGPGTGKTELLSMRAANILKQTDTLPENILCLTFTDSGAAAMRQRLSEIIGPQAYKIAIHTFHSFGTETINQNGNFFYHGANFRATSELSSYELLRTIFDELEYDNPLASKMNDEYTHLRDTLTTISELKKSGLTSDELLTILDANDQVIETVEPLLANILGDRVSKTTADQLAPLVKTIRASGGDIAFPGTTSLSRIMADSLATAIDDAVASGSTKPISSWKSTWMKKDDQGNLVIKSRDRAIKLRAVSYIYYQYLSRMQQAELYDFDDMILRVVHAMEVFPELRFNLQEKYQYIMVDEFQDTNMAQMRILHNLTNNEVSGSRPNILVVGDDDQAIYSFQGADVGNISSFLDLYDQTKMITLTDNYRSTETVLAHARDVITIGTQRLENSIAELNKTLIAHRPNTNSAVRLVQLPTASSERSWLAATIASEIKAGTSPSSIAVLARRHHEITALLPYLAKQGISVNYERRDNVLDLEIITLIEHLASLLVALFEQRHDIADSLLPELLAHPAFVISPIDIWQLSLQAKTNHQTWMERMAVTPRFVPLHAWLITQSQAIAHTPLEQMLDTMVGSASSASSRSTIVTQDNLQPKADQAPGPLSDPERSHVLGDDGRKGEQNSPFISPIYRYYFAPEKLTDTPTSYLTYLEALRTIRTKLREYQPNETPTLQSFLEFMRLNREFGSTITNARSHVDHSEQAINLMTAHKSKGLEFEHVYVVGAVDSAWGERVRTRSRLISYPENLPLAPSGDTFDERLRLFFVAMTRAKRQLTISYAMQSDQGKTTLPASFLVGESWQPIQPDSAADTDSLITAAEIMWYQPIITPIEKSMRELLAPTLENYKLSSTHLSNFLDVTRGGPQGFLIHNLLRFPQAIKPSAGYGVAIHAALQRAHAHLAATKKQRPIEDILNDFETSLRLQHLAEDDFKTYLQKGTDTLTAFLGAKYNDFTPDQKVELNFANQMSLLGDAHLTGSLDLVDINDNELIVTDYKTGKASSSWLGKTDFEKIKLHRYKQQLMFYQLLVNNARDYHNYTFAQGVLQFVEPTARGEIIALQATFGKEDLEQFSQLIQKVWHHIVTLDLPDTSQYEPTYKGILAFEANLLNEPS
jgi:DNA helicase-2/ATP-dependent DNA helicase PcrA